MVAGGLKHGLMTDRKSPSRRKPVDHQAKYGEHHDHEAGRPGVGHITTPDVTQAQLSAVASISLFALLLGIVAPANWLNLRLSARAVGGAIMPPGMIMDRDTPAATMIDMAAVDPRDIVATYGLDVQGNRELAPHIENGVKVFDLDTSVIKWAILPGITVDAYAFNTQVPGPRLHFRQRDRVRINVTNHLPESTAVHWHGLILPNIMDGPAHITQEPIAIGSRPWVCTER